MICVQRNTAFKTCCFFTESAVNTLSLIQHMSHILRCISSTKTMHDQNICNHDSFQTNRHNNRFAETGMWDVAKRKFLVIKVIDYLKSRESRHLKLFNRSFITLCNLPSLRSSDVSFLIVQYRCVQIDTLQSGFLDFGMTSLRRSLLQTQQKSHHLDHFKNILKRFRDFNYILFGVTLCV